MAEPFTSEIRIMSFGYAPRGWAMCNGQFLPINQNQALFSLLGTTFGGNGQTTFALPDLRGQTPIHVGSGHVLGEKGGAQSVTLTISQLPTHTHVASGVNLAAATADPTNALLSQPSQALGTVYESPPTALAAMNLGSIGSIGGSQAHLNMQPFLTLNFCIALQGIFPSPN
jgi:microcystin-dependent protein